MPWAYLKSGNRWANRPDCSVEVVDAITMDAVWAETDAEKTAAENPIEVSARRQNSLKFFIKILQ
jgi:hypothetical protein